jgi:hypothetical protein
MSACFAVAALGAAAGLALAGQAVPAIVCAVFGAVEAVMGVWLGYLAKLARARGNATAGIGAPAPAEAAQAKRYATALMWVVVALSLLAVVARVAGVLKGPDGRPASPPATFPPAVQASLGEQMCATALETSLAGIAQGDSTDLVVRTVQTTIAGLVKDPGMVTRWARSEAVSYARELKALGPATATADMHRAVVEECPLLGFEFVP